jgi:DNA-binding transcriptional MerR regulator
MGKKHTTKTITGIGIGDVSKICGIPDYTIRYWEREFKNELSPPRTKGKQRRYTDHDINKLLQIKKLLWIDKFSIKGAKRVLRGNIILPDLGKSNNFSPTDKNDLAIQIAELITQQLTRIESAA